MVRHGDPGIASWMVDSEEAGRQLASDNRDAVIEFTTSMTEQLLRTTSASHSVSIADLIEAGFIDENDELTSDIISDAISEYINDDYVDRWDGESDEYDHEFYDSDWDITSYGGLS